MSQQTWVETLITEQVDGTAYPFTGGVAGSILTPNPQLWFPANYFTTIGKKLRIKAAGRVSNIITTPGTLKLDVMMGPATPTINVFTSGTMALNIVAKTNVTWYMDVTLTVRAVGAAALTTFMGVGNWESESAIGSPAGAAGSCSMPATAPAVGSGINNSVPNVIDLYATWSLTGNTIQLHQYSIEAMN